MDIDHPRATTATVLAAAQSGEFYEMLNILVSSIEVLKDDEERQSNEPLQMQIKTITLMEELSKIKISVEESNVFFEGVKYQQDILNQDLISLQEKIDDLQYVSYDGAFIWKITNLKEKMRKLSNYS
ncbi:unnamed protein product [Rotaria sp. Silwood2]|nr:unnamed protein product [Rotaria sp. Silwood2]CAF4453730.1 unnamed protein product [Rotaria sp. Silwood2]